MTRTRTLWITVIVLLAGWGLLTFRIGGAWVGHQDANGAWISSAIRNYERYGFASLGGMIVLNNDSAEPDSYNYYASHPPLPVWLPSMPVLLVGYHEAVMRFVFAACTLLSAAALFAFVRVLLGQTQALWSMAFYLFTPMTAYFGRMPDHEAPALLFLMLFAWVLVLYQRRPSRGRWLVLAALMLAEAWTAWGGLIGIMAVAAAGMWFGRRDTRRAIFALMALGVIAAVLVIVFYQLQWPETLESFVQKWLWRTSNQSMGEDSETFTMGQYALRMLLRGITLFTPTICLIALLGLVPLARKLSGIRRALPGALLLSGLGYVLLFRNASYVHDYYLIYMTPAVAVLAAIGLLTYWEQRRTRRWMRPLLLGLLIVTPIALLRYTEGLYQGSDQTDPVTLAQTIAQVTNPGDLIMSNLPTVGPAIEFYAARDIAWGVPPEEAIRRNTGQQSVYYILCGEENVLPADTSVLSDVEMVSSCYLLRLR